MDTTQILLVIVISVLTVMIVVIGIQVVLILKEIKKSLEKVNQMIDHAATVTKSVSQTGSGASGVVEGIKAGLSLVSAFHKKKS